MEMLVEAVKIIRREGLQVWIRGFMVAFGVLGSTHMRGRPFKLCQGYNGF